MFDKWHNYFDSIGHFLAQRMADEHFCETSATDLLCQLLDEKNSADYKLAYSLADLKRELDYLGEPYHVTINTAKQLGNERNSGLDLGVKFIQHTLDGTRERGLLLQAKRLYPRPIGGYSMDGSYSAFDRNQMDKILNTLEMEAVRSGFYLLLNPERASFDDAAEIDEYEMKLANQASYHCHKLRRPEEFYPRCPGTRLSDLHTVRAASGSGDLKLRSVMRYPELSNHFLPLLIV